MNKKQKLNLTDNHIIRTLATVSKLSVPVPYHFHFALFSAFQEMRGRTKKNKIKKKKDAQEEETWLIPVSFCFLLSSDWHSRPPFQWFYFRELFFGWESEKVTAAESAAFLETCEMKEKQDGSISITTAQSKSRTTSSPFGSFFSSPFSCDVFRFFLPSRRNGAFQTTTCTTQNSSRQLDQSI